jgi:hypothetical protein
MITVASSPMEQRETRAHSRVNDTGLKGVEHTPKSPQPVRQFTKIIADWARAIGDYL